MPNITDFEAPALDIRPSETGVEATARAGLRLGGYGNQIAQAKEREGQELGSSIHTAGEAADSYISQREISAAAKHGADVMLAGSQSLNAFMSGSDIPDDPNNPQTKKDALNARLQNPNAVQEWRDNKLEPMLNQYRNSGFFITDKGQEYADRFVATTREHFVTTALADQSTVAGHVVKDNLQKTADGYATTVFDDPHNLNVSMAAFDHAVDSIGTTVDAKTQGAIKEWAEQEKGKIVTAAVQGRIIKGAGYDDITKAYGAYVNPGQNYQFEKQAQFYQKGQENAQKQQILLDHAIAEDNAHKFMNDAYGKYVHTDETGKTTIDPQYAVEVGKIPTMFRNAPSAVLEAERQQSWVAREQKPETEARISNDTYVGILRDMRGADVSNTDVQKQILDKAWNARLTDPGKPGSMTEKDFTSVRTEIEARKTPEGAALASSRDLFFKRFSLQFDPSGGQNTATAGNGYLAEMAARQQEITVQKAGGDPKSVYDPNSPNFFGTAANINKFKVPLQQQLQSLPSANRPGPQTPPANAPVTSKAQYDALPSGAQFVDEKGRRFVKP